MKIIFNMAPEISQILEIINLNNPVFSQFIFILRIVLIIISAFFLGFIVFALIKTYYLRRLILWDVQEFLTYKPYAAKKLYKQWQGTKARLGTGLESEYKLAVIEADSVLNDVLEKMGFAGATLGERLEKVTDETIPNVAEAVDAHKVRNNIVHDPDYHLTLDEARKIINIFERVLTDLQAL